MFCPYCGSQIPDNSSSCPVCGRPLSYARKVRRDYDASMKKQQEQQAREAARQEAEKRAAEQAAQQAAQQEAARQQAAAAQAQQMAETQAQQFGTDQVQMGAGSAGDMGSAPGYQASPAYGTPFQITEDMLPPQFKPIGAWAYFGLTLVFGIPILGKIIALIVGIAATNRNIKSFARSFFCMLIIEIVVFLILMACGINLANVISQAIG